MVDEPSVSRQDADHLDLARLEVKPDAHLAVADLARRRDGEVLPGVLDIGVRQFRVPLADPGVNLRRRRSLLSCDLIVLRKYAHVKAVIGIA